MEIAYIRFNNSIELDYSRSSVSIKGTGRRLGIFDALKEQGHNVHIYSSVKKSDLHLLNMRSLVPQSNPLSNVSIHSGIPNDEDVLVIENATTNTLFSYGKDHTSFIKHTFEIIDKWSGPIVYLQWDVELPFPFGESNADLTPGVSDRNLTKMGSEIDMFKNKTWNIVTTALNTKKFIEINNNARCKYSEFVKKVTPIQLCYSPNIDIRFGPKPDPKYPIVYVGTQSDNYRNKLLSKYLILHKTAMFGKWESDKLKKLFPWCHYGGVISGHSNVYNLYNDSYCSVQCGENHWAELDHMTSRFFHILGGGSLPLLIDGYSKKFVDLYLGDNNDLHISNETEFVSVVDAILSLSLSERRDMINNILLHNKKWSDLDWEKILRGEA